MSFKAEVSAFVGWAWDSGAKDANNQAIKQEFVEGNAADQAEAVWHVEDVTLNSGATTTLDLSALTRTVLGSTITTALVLVKAILIQNTSANTAVLTVGAAGTNEWSAPFGAAGDVLVLPPGASVLLLHPNAGWTVDGTHKALKLAASVANATYSIAILGTITP